MNALKYLVPISLAHLLANPVLAQPAIAESYLPGGWPVSAQAGPSAQEKADAKALRRQAGIEAAHGEMPTEGEPYSKGAKTPKAQRAEGRAARKAEIVRANKAGEIPTGGEDSDPG